MKPAATAKWFRTGVLALGLAVLLAGCMPKYYPPALPPPPPAPAPSPPQVIRPVYYVKANRLNLRACPGYDCPKISLLERGEEVEKVGASEDWFQIRVKRDGRLGWVASQFLSSTPVTPEAAPAPPGVVTPPPLPEPIQPPPLPEKPAPAKPPAAEKPKPAKPAEGEAPPAKKKPEEAKPAKPPKPEPDEEAAPAPRKPAPAVEKPAPKKEEKPAPPPEPESGKKIRIM